MKNNTDDFKKIAKDFVFIVGECVDHRFVCRSERGIENENRLAWVQWSPFRSIENRVLCKCVLGDVEGGLYRLSVTAVIDGKVAQSKELLVENPYRHLREIKKYINSEL